MSGALSETGRAAQQGQAEDCRRSERKEAFHCDPRIRLELLVGSKEQARLWEPAAGYFDKNSQNFKKSLGGSSDH
jgi:hypothetical protein